MIDSEISSTATSRIGDHNGVVKIEESERDFQLIAEELILGMGGIGKCTRVQNVYRKAYTSLRDREKLQQFKIFRHGLKIKRGGDPNENYAWYGASKIQIGEVLSRGFTNPIIEGTHGRGIYLAPRKFPQECLESAIPDKFGIRHILFCRVVLGNTEVIQPGSNQCYPSCEEFDSGIDSLVSPTKYIIWTSRMNHQILPEFMISFKVLSATTKVKIPASISDLFLELSMMLPHSREVIAKHRKDVEEGKMTMKQLQWNLRTLAGDYLLVQAIKSCKNKRRLTF